MPNNKNITMKAETKRYNPLRNNKGWNYGQKMNGHNEWHSYLGPCPYCGFRTFDYGGGWRCLDPDCWYSFTNPMPSVGSRPNWWLSDIDVYKDGSAWCAVKSGFINLQESHAGFGDTPNEAVKNLIKLITPLT